MNITKVPGSDLVCISMEQTKREIMCWTKWHWMGPGWRVGLDDMLGRSKGGFMEDEA